LLLHTPPPDRAGPSPSPETIPLDVLGWGGCDNEKDIELTETHRDHKEKIKN